MPLHQCPVAASSAWRKVSPVPSRHVCPTVPAGASMSYSSFAGQGSMVFDAVRNEAYARAIREAVRPGAVVMDLGAGLGVHGLLAAAAGAARVYVVEPQPVVRLVAEAARAMGMADRIVILQDRIEAVRLPEQVDVIVSVFTGNLLFSEDLLPSLFHARERWLKPGGTLVPHRAQLWLAPLQAAELHDKLVARWSRPFMGIDYAAVRAFAANELGWVRREDLADTRLLGDGAALTEVDFMQAAHADCDGRAACEVREAGTCHGLLAWTRIGLQDQWLSTGPQAPAVHWSPVYLPIDPPLPLAAGATLQMGLQRPTGGDWTWTVSCGNSSRRHSTFLSRPEGLRELARLAPQARPGLDARGQQALDILSGLGQGRSLAEVAAQLQERTGMAADAALREVQALVRRWGGEPR